MKRSILRKTIAALAASFPAASWGLGLGDASVQSYFNEPLRAELTLLEIGTLGPGDIRIGLASAQEFERLGVARSQFLTQLNFEVQGSGAAAVAVMTTEQALQEPYLNFVVEARWPDGRLLREYTLLIDLPPSQTNGNASIAASASSSPVVVTEEESPVAAGNIQEEIRPGGAYLVRNADTLWRIAFVARPEGVTMEQEMLSIVATNPEAFQGENVNGLKSGYLLSLPTADEISIAVADAQAEVSRQNAVWAGVEPLETPGLTLVADPPPGSELSLPHDAQEIAEVTSFEDAGDTASEGSFESASPAQELGSAAPAFEALLSKVETLERNLERMERQLNERDAELERLRAQLTLVAERAKDPGPETTVAGGGPIKALPAWVWLSAIGVLISGGLGVWWGQRGRALSRSDVGDSGDLGETLESRKTEPREAIAVPEKRPVGEGIGEPNAADTTSDESAAVQSAQRDAVSAEAEAPFAVPDSEGSQAEAGLSLVP
ncbi:MAG: FimV/HubP family polar landmark protein, partial [Halieaceae bacterium]